jgi:peptidoglycan hydrolase-like protein with peptidoglycan-binding domain
MAAEKEKPESTEKPASAPAVDTSSAAPDKSAGPQPAARTADQNGGTTGRARMVESMQQQVGNARVGRMFAGGVQRKATVSSPEDASEKEADHMAEKVMRMSNEDAASSTPASGNGGGSGSGQPMSKSDRDFMEPRFGRSFDTVRLHTDREANDQATALGAKAFTQGSNISFGPGSGPDDKKLLAHELTHVAQQGDGVMRAPGPLTAAEEASARQFTANHYDERSVRIIQIITGTAVDGIFGDISAQAVATFQGARGLAVDGKVGPNTLNQMVADRVAANRREHAIQLVIDFHDLDVKSDTLSVHFDSTLGVILAATTFESGNLRVIRLGPGAFASEPTLFATIFAELITPAPAVPPLAPRPAVLTRDQERSAISFNNSHFSDRRSVLAIQGHVGTNPDAIFGPDTVQRIADRQRIAGLAVDGKVGRATLELFVTELIAAGQENAAIRLIVDFFNIRDNGNLLDVFFDPALVIPPPQGPANAATDFRPNEPVRVRIGPLGIAQPFPNLVHTIAHEFEHVRRLKEGIADAPTHEFLGEAIEILSVGMPEEDFTGFVDDANNAVTNWNRMPLPNRQRFRARFIAVRQRVRARFAAATAPEQAANAAVLTAFNAVVLP